MSKYIIELPDNVKKIVYFHVGNANAIWTTTNDLDDLEVLNSDYINEHYGELQDEAYKRGLEDAWEAVRKIALMDTETSENVTGYFGLFRIMENLTPMQAIEKLKAYEDKRSDRIEVGDEVVWNDGTTLTVTRVYKLDDDEWCDGMAEDGRMYGVLKNNVRKTGNHYDIQSILEAMKK